MQYARQEKARPIAPRIIIHGGAGNITRDNLPEASYGQYSQALLNILHHASIELQKPNAAAVDVATYAVSLLEKNPLFNAGHGAVYTTNGTHELEASIMVSRGYIKRGVGVMQCRHVKSPITLARELLVRGELENGGGGQGHCQLTGETCDRLAQEWGLEMVKPSYFWTRKRWDEHRRGLGLENDDSTYEKHRREADEDQSCSTDSNLETDAQDPSWDGKEYLPQGTVGTVVLDSEGVLCVCTSTGGLTNKLPGRIGDTPTLGAGFWAEQWYENQISRSTPTPSPFTASWLADCLPSLTSYSALPTDTAEEETSRPKLRAAAMSGTGNGDSFLRINAVRTAAAIARYSGANATSLQSAVTAVAGPHGQLQLSAGDRWHKTGEGEGGMIGIELKDERGYIVYDHNCGGMFRAWIDDNGEPRFGVFQDEKDR